MADRPICTIQPCDRVQYAKGMCQTHYRRHWRHGDPRFVKIEHACRNAHKEWISSHLDYEGNECLVWPFPRNKSGYGKSTIGGKYVSAHRIICRLSKGEPPSPRHIVAHSCGNGHLGCVNPRHLRWATHKENSADSALHGTIARGERQHCAKLTKEKVLEIRKLRKLQNVSQKEIATMFGLAQSTVWGIINNRSWRWLSNEQ